jgi:catechol 2,3-dioxygenase-like lactoylglutathione lyase family enzyme
MIDHIKLFVSDVGRSRRFYEHALAPLGYRVILEPSPEVVGMGAGMPDFWLAPAGRGPNSRPWRVGLPVTSAGARRSPPAGGTPRPAR